MDTFTIACDNFGLTISTKKADVMLQPAAYTSYMAPSIKVNGQKLQSAEQFTHLAEPYPEQYILMMKSTAELPKPAVPSAGDEPLSVNADKSAFQLR